MVIKYGKERFVRTILKGKKTNRLDHRLNDNLEYWIKELFPNEKRSKIIDNAIAEYLYHNGLNIIDDFEETKYRKEAKKGYVKGHCKNCHYYKNW